MNISITVTLFINLINDVLHLCINIIKSKDRLNNYPGIF